MTETMPFGSRRSLVIRVDFIIVRVSSAQGLEQQQYYGYREISYFDSNELHN